MRSLRNSNDRSGCEISFYQEACEWSRGRSSRGIFRNAHGRVEKTRLSVGILAIRKRENVATLGACVAQHAAKLFLIDVQPI
jgi:hypothetical protein